MPPTHRVRLVVLAALSGCPRSPATDVVDTDAVDTDVADTDVADTDVADTVVDSPVPEACPQGDADGDGACDDVDRCDGPGVLADDDHDRVCTDVDACRGDDATGDGDGDGWCDDVDPCDDRVVAPGTTCVPPDPIPPDPCHGEPRLHEGRHTGFVTCPNGSVDRLFATSGWLAPETTEPFPGPHFYAFVDDCRSDAECTDRPNGACVGVHNGYEAVNHCFYGCDGDADCAVGSACLPPTAGMAPYEVRLDYVEGSALGGRGVCIAADCRTGADCDSGRCGYAWNAGSCLTGAHVLGCRDPFFDACEVRASCIAPFSGDYGSCDYVGQGFACEAFTLTCGRPLLDVAGEAVLAPTRVGTGDWQAAVVVGVPSSRKARRAVARHWAHVGALEHASVASFARHALQLLALGAPADLVADVTAAMADEVRHAQAAFGVAAALGHAVVPGPMPVDRAGLGVDVDAVLEGLVREGCVGETIAAAEAGWLAERAVDAGVRRVLEAIAEDEARHAALAWRTVAWLVDGDPARLDRVEGLVAELFATPTGTGDGEGLVGWGLVDGAGRAAVRASVLADVVGPAVAALRARRAA